MLKTFNYKGIAEGSHILLTARIHGNEPCGEIALNRLIQNIENDSIKLHSGQLTLIPSTNPQGAQENKRFIDINMNRIFSRELTARHHNTYEAPLCDSIMNAIDDCDYFIDLHSFTEDMPPCIICIDDQNEKSKQMATVCPIKHIVCDTPFLTKEGTRMSTHYAREQSKPAVLIECGQHDSPQSIETAYQSIINILNVHGMIDTNTTPSPSHEFLKITGTIHYNEGEDLIFPLMERNNINIGEPLFKTSDGQIINSTVSGTLFMRNANTPINEEYATVYDLYDQWPQ